MKFDQLVHQLLEQNNAKQSIAISDKVLFEFDASTLTQSGNQVLQQLAKAIIDSGSEYLQNTIQVTVKGHTDLYGKDNYNAKLSQERANNVSDVLKNLVSNYPNITFASQGLASSQPKVSLERPAINNKAPEQGKQQQQPNRRVEISFNPPLPQQVVTTVQKIPQLSITSGPNPAGQFVSDPAPEKKYYKVIAPPIKKHGQGIKGGPMSGPTTPGGKFIY